MKVCNILTFSQQTSEVQIIISISIWENGSSEKLGHLPNVLTSVKLSQELNVDIKTQNLFP